MGNTADEGFALEALRAGDRAEFSPLVEAYSANIYRLALKMLTTAGYLRCFRRLFEGFSPPENFRRALEAFDLVVPSIAPTRL
jgi:hypothetical protein